MAERTKWARTGFFAYIGPPGYEWRRVLFFEDTPVSVATNCGYSGA